MTATQPMLQPPPRPSPWRSRFTRAFAHPLEALLLVGLIVFLPSFEAPKNILWLAYVLAWVYFRARDRNWGGAWDKWDNLILAWILSGYVVAAFAGLHHSEWRGGNDILRYGAVLWLVKRSGYGKDALAWVLVALAVSTVGALVLAYWDLFVSHSRKALELNSVGHVNHSAIYLTVSYGAMLFLTVAYWRGFGWLARLTAGLITFLFALSVLISASRGAVGVALLLTLIAGVTWMRRSRYVLPVLLSLMVMGAGAAYLGKAQIVLKQENYIQTNNLLSFRDQIWDAALIAWRRYPLMGVGMDNFEEINADRLRQWSAGQGQAFPTETYKGTSHAHNLFLNTLAERGLFGLAVLMAVLLAWLRELWRHVPGKTDEALAWALWGGSLSAWVVTVCIGAVNTTLHHEHAILSVLFLGMWLAYLRLDITNPPRTE